jgi:hypothetical protein
MKKNGKPLENKMLFYVVCVIAIFNIIAYLSVRDWHSLIFFVLAAMVAYGFKLGNTLILIIAILSANIFRASNIMREGLETKKKQKAVPKPNEKKTDFADADDDEDDKQHSTETLEGLTKSAHKLMDRQQSLQAMTNQLEPMMKQAMQMMNQLPKDFLKKNMKNNSNT